MLSVETVKLFQLFLNINYKLNFCRVYWDGEKGRFVKCVSTWKFLAWTLNMLYMVISSIFILKGMMERVTRNTDDNNNGPEEQQNSSKVNLAIHILFMCCIPCFVMTSVSTSLLHTNQLIQYLNQLFSLNNYFARRFQSEGTLPEKDGVGKGLRLLPWWCLWNCVVMSLLFALQSHDSRYIYGHLVAMFDVERDYPCIFAIFYILEMNALAVMLFQVSFYWIFFFMIFTHSIHSWLDKIQYKEGVTEELNPDACHFCDHLKAYTMLRLVNKMYNNCVSTLVWPIFVFNNLSNHVLFIYITVRFHGRLGLVGLFFPTWMVLYVIIEVIVYYLPGRMYEQSRDCLHSWDRHSVLFLPFRRYKRRTVRAQQCFGVMVEPFFVLKKYAPLHVFYLISNLTINLLLTL